MRNSFLIAALLLSACQHRGTRVESVEEVEYVDRQVPIAAPCKETVTRPVSPILEALGMEPEIRVAAALQDNRVLRAYIASLEAAGLSCGVTILGR